MLEFVFDIFWFLCGIAWELLLFSAVDKITQGFVGTTSGNDRQAIWMLECAGLFLLSAVVYIYHMPYILFTLACCTVIYTIFLHDKEFGNYWRGLRTTWQDCHDYYDSLKHRGQNTNSSAQTQQDTTASTSAPPPSIQNPPVTPAWQPNPPRASPAGGGGALPQNQNVPVSSPLASTAPLLAKTQPSPRTGSPVIPPPSNTRTVAQNLPVVGNSASAKKLDRTCNSGRIADAADYVFSHMPNTLTSITTWIWNKFGRDASIPPGLFNGSQNLCFINCTLQALARSPQLRDKLQLELASGHTQHISVEALTFLKEAVNVFLKLTVIVDATPEGQPLYNITQGTWALRKAISDIGHFELVVDPSNSKDSQQQQDAAEFLLWLLSNLHDALNVPTTGVVSYARPGIHANQFPYSPPTTSAQVALDRLRFRYCYPTTENINDLKRKCNLELLNANGGNHSTYVHLVTRLSDLDWMLYKNKNNSIADDLFTGQQASAFCCQGCNHISVTTETFRILMLPIPSGYEIVSITNCFEELIKLETLTPQNRPRINSCKCLIRTDNFETSTPNGPQRPGCSPGMGAMSPINGVGVSRGQCIATPPYTPSTPALSNPLQPTNAGCVRQTTLQRLPDCLVVQLLRFSFVNDKGIKLDTRVKVFVNPIDLSPLILVRQTHPEPMLYSLYGICMHCDSSSVQSGHYCTYSLSSDGQWYLFNDETVSKVNIERELEKKDVQENIYILYYRKVASWVQS